ncbi:MAG: hypothetical protein IPG70_05665 [Moraxellaceae bacterium]|nr:hypothetical protein [Moraxellaceae bacterium]
MAKGKHSTILETQRASEIRAVNAALIK